MMPLNKEDLLNHLDEQLALLEASCESFDSGLDAQAKSMSTYLHTLLHETKTQKSLLSQLGLKDCYFLSTSSKYDNTGRVTYIGGFSGLTSIKMTLGGNQDVEYVPHLAHPSEPIRRLSFTDWWNEIILSTDSSGPLSRGDLVVNMRSKDGGSHIDPKLSDAYGNLVKDSLGWVGINDTGEFKLNSIERVSMRQIAFEILVMFRENGRTTFEGLENANRRDQKIGRNEHCPCRSGKKYKHCHGK